MVTLADYGKYETAWCPGCGNFGILNAMKQALVASGLEPHQVLFVSGIGQAAKAPHYLNANLFNGLHGRALPVATGAKLANPALRVVVRGDGCMYGRRKPLSAVRRNIGLAVIVHDNQVYGLTKDRRPDLGRGLRDSAARCSERSPSGDGRGAGNFVARSRRPAGSPRPDDPRGDRRAGLRAIDVRSHASPSTRSTPSNRYRERVRSCRRTTIGRLGAAMTTMTR
jgi:hypothetical protein